MVHRSHNEPDRPADRVHAVMPDVVVVGAGPSGLAVARELGHRHGVSALVVDKAFAPAVSWRTRYDSFRLNTNGFLSHLPGQRIPLSTGRWPTKDHMVSYFDSYVRRQRITVELSCEIHRIDRAGDRWRAQATHGGICAPAVVLATGRYHTPAIPSWPGIDGFTGTLVHSVDFRNAWPFRGQDVLVVGAGNSAADIAVQLSANGARRVWLAVRTPPHLVPRTIGSIPSDVFLELFERVPAHLVDPVIARFNRLLIGDLSPYGLGRPPLGLKATVEERGRIPTLADELVSAVRAGRIDVVAAVEAFDVNRVLLGDCTDIRPQVIIAATGFQPDLGGLVGHLGVLDDHGNPRGGFATDLGAGLFAIGYGIPPNGPLRAIRRAATPLAARVAEYLHAREDCCDRTPAEPDFLPRL